MFDNCFSFDSGSVSINDVEYTWKSKGTGSRMVVGRLAVSLDPDEVLKSSSAGERRHERDSRRMPKQETEQLLQEHEPGDLGNDVPRRGHHPAHVRPRME